MRVHKFMALIFVLSVSFGCRNRSSSYTKDGDAVAPDNGAKIVLDSANLEFDNLEVANFYVRSEGDAKIPLAFKTADDKFLMYLKVSTKIGDTWIDSAFSSWFFGDANGLYQDDKNENCREIPAASAEKLPGVACLVDHDLLNKEKSYVVTFDFYNNLISNAQAFGAMAKYNNTTKSYDFTEQTKVVRSFPMNVEQIEEVLAAIREKKILLKSQPLYRTVGFFGKNAEGTYGALETYHPSGRKNDKVPTTFRIFSAATPEVWNLEMESGLAAGFTSTVLYKTDKGEKLRESDSKGTKASIAVLATDGTEKMKFEEDPENHATSIWDVSAENIKRMQAANLDVSIYGVPGATVEHRAFKHYIDEQK